MRIFCELRGIKKKFEQWAKCPPVLYAKPSNKGFTISLQKIVILKLASIFLVRVFRNILISSVRMMLTMSKIFARIICETTEWEVNYFNTKKMLFWRLFSVIFSSVGSSSSAIVASFAYAGFRPAVNRLNQDTTVYYSSYFANCFNLVS